MPRSGWGVNGPAWAGHISRENQGGTVVSGPDWAIVWSCCSYGQGTVINTSAQRQAVWPICFLLGGKRKQWGGVLHTVGDWHYLLERSVEAFLLRRHSPQVERSHFTSVRPRLSHQIQSHSFICCVPDCLLLIDWVNPIQRKGLDAYLFSGTHSYSAFSQSQAMF